MAGHVSLEGGGAIVDAERFPGRQGRLVFVYLVAASGRPVAKDELVDLLWGDEPPATWDKALSVLVSKLRPLLAECGIDASSALTSAFGCYRLTLPAGASVDVDTAVSALAAAETALAADASREAQAQAAVAAAVARKPFLVGESGVWVEEQRRGLDDVLVRALECLAAASLELGEAGEALRHASAVTELEPFRESGYRLTMQAHVAAGNPAEALRVYERCRRFLADELGTYPSSETEGVYRALLEAGIASSPQLAAEPASPVAAERPGSSSATSHRRHRPRHRQAAVLLLGAAAVTALAVVVARHSTDRVESGAAADAPRVALLVPREPDPERPDTFVNPLVDGLRLAERQFGVEGEVFVVDELQLDSAAARATVARVVAGRFDLVLASSIELAHPFASEEMPGTRWVVFNSPVDVPEATEIVFDDRRAGFLAGYLSGPMEQSRHPRQNAAHVLSMIGGLPEPAGALLDGFEEGVRLALPNAVVHRAYSNDFVDQAKCAEIANRHIDRGADIVFTAAGTCGLGALSAAALRGVWAVATDGDQSRLGPHVLASTTKRGDQAVLVAVRAYLNRTLTGGATMELGLDDDVVGLVGLNPDVPGEIRRKLTRVAADLRAGRLSAS